VDLDHIFSGCWTYVADNVKAIASLDVLEKIWIFRQEAL